MANTWVNVPSNFPILLVFWCPVHVLVTKVHSQFSRCVCGKLWQVWENYSTTSFNTKLVLYTKGSGFLLGNKGLMKYAVELHGKLWEVKDSGPPPLTCNCELPFCADRGSIITGNAGVIAVVFERHLGYLEGAHELLCVDGDARGWHNLLPVLAPSDAYGHVSRRHHAGNVHQFTNGSRRKVKRLDQWRNWGR